MTLERVPYMAAEERGAAERCEGEAKGSGEKDDAAVRCGGGEEKEEVDETAAAPTLDVTVLISPAPLVTALATTRCSFNSAPNPTEFVRGPFSARPAP